MIMSIRKVLANAIGTDYTCLAESGNGEYSGPTSCPSLENSNAMKIESGSLIVRD